MNYFKKYLKYKKKYLNLKKNKVLEGGNIFEVTTETSLTGLTEMKNALITTESISENFVTGPLVIDPNAHIHTFTISTINKPNADIQTSTIANNPTTSVAETVNLSSIESSVETNLPSVETNLPSVGTNLPSVETTPTSPVMNGGFLLRGLLTENSLDITSTDTI